MSPPVRILSNPTTLLTSIIVFLWSARLTVAQIETPAQTPIPGDAMVRRSVGDSEIVITTTSRLAGAIHSLTWNGREFINSTDHGRQLQSASNLDFGSPMTGETFNPTEAGSRRDGTGQVSTSRLLHLIATGHTLQTTTQMAFWLNPGELSGGHPAKNTMPLSNHLLTKRVVIGYRDQPDVLQYDVTFGLPVDEHHKYAQFEAVTGYMPAGFDQFLTFNPETGEFEPLSDGPGEQPRPVVLATSDGQFAMGCYSPHRPPPKSTDPQDDTVPRRTWTGPGYGRWRFTAQKVVKWNCVFRCRSADRVPPGDYAFRILIPVGTLESVRRALIVLHNEPTQQLSDTPAS